MFAGVALIILGHGPEMCQIRIMPKGKPRTALAAVAQHGVTMATIRSRSDIASMLREKVHEENITTYIVMVLQGKNPIFVEDADGPGGQIVVDSGGRCPVERQDAYFKILLERRDGLPAQRIHLEAEVRARAQQTVLPAGTADAARALDIETLRKVRELLGGPRNHADAIDAEFTEVATPIEPESMP